jgi:hypothetical protein
MAPTEATYDLPFGFSKAAVQVKNPSLAATIVASAQAYSPPAPTRTAPLAIGSC